MYNESKLIRNTGFGMIVVAIFFLIFANIYSYANTSDTAFPVEALNIQTLNMDTSPVITVAQSSPVIEATVPYVEEKEVQQTIIEEAEREAYRNSITFNPSNVTQISNLSREDMKILTEGTWWAGYEDSLYDLEHTYGINAAFAMAVSSLESGCGTSSRAKNRNNFYGLELSRTYSSRYDCTMYFGDLMNRMYTGQGRISVYAIGPKYCPPNRKWEGYMEEYMINCRSKVASGLSL